VCRLLVSSEKNRNCITLWRVPDLNCEEGTSL